MKDEKNVIQKIQNYALEEIMGLRFSAYAKEIIQDRAIPDVRDGLKPVQRRILYGMYHDHNTYDKPYRKCAKIVGLIMGNYHPHGDSSIYDAMVRMSQWWKQSTPYIDIHGNNGSMDGDGAAAMRYTECRLAKISDELLSDIYKNTVSWAPNFDDTELEPTVLPVKFPNLLVNGSNGISAGYATNIPPHNLSEVIDATIKRIDSPNCRLDTILEIIKGPDFPTGGIVEGKDGIVDAFTTGRGKVIVRSKYEFKKEKGKEQIIINEIPFDVNKAILVQKMDAIRIDKKIDGISEVRDESDRDGLRIVIDLKPGANKDIILAYFLKNTDLQISYNYNMVAIVNKRPMTLGIIPILDAYIEHLRTVITSRTKFDLDTYKTRLNIVDGFLKMMDILDQVIHTIRSSKNKSDAKENLIKEYGFNPEQAEAIVMLQLYRLTNTDIVALEDEKANLLKLIEELTAILDDDNKLKDVMKKELRSIKQVYGTPRKTIIQDEVTDIKLEQKDLIIKEDVIVTITHEGYIKKVSKKSLKASNGDQVQLKPGDYILKIMEVNTLDNIVVFFNSGNYAFIPVHIINDGKWKDIGKHINNLVGGITGVDEVLNAFVLGDINTFTATSKNGFIKQTNLKDLEVSRYSKAITYFKLKEDDQVVSVYPSKEKVLITTSNGKYLNFMNNEVSIVGPKASGVKGIGLKDDYVIAGLTYNDSDEYLGIVTNNKTGKRIKLSLLDLAARAQKGSNLYKKVKAKPYKVISSFVINSKDEVLLITGDNINLIKAADIPIMDIDSTGSSISKANISKALIKPLYEAKNNIQEEVETTKEEPIIKESVIMQTSLDDFYEDFKL